MKTCRNVLCVFEQHSIRNMYNGYMINIFATAYVIRET